jgi:hypothetical protein
VKVRGFRVLEARSTGSFSRILLENGGAESVVGRGVDVHVNVGGGGGKWKGLVEVLEVVKGKARRIKIDKFLGCNIVRKTLKESTTEAVNLGLGNRPRGINTGGAAKSDGIKLVSTEFLNRGDKVRERWKRQLGQRSDRVDRDGDRGSGGSGVDGFFFVFLGFLRGEAGKGWSVHNLGEGREGAGGVTSGFLREGEAGFHSEGSRWWE